MTKRDVLGEIANSHRHDSGVIHSHDPAEHSAEEAAQLAARNERALADIARMRARPEPTTRPRQPSLASETPFALSEERGRLEAAAAFIAMANINSAAERWTGVGDMPGKVAVLAMGGMIAKRDWSTLTSALAGLFDAFANSSQRVAAFIERDARVDAIIARGLGLPFGPFQKTGPQAFVSKIPVFYEAFRSEFIWICRHTIATDPGDQRIAAAWIQGRVRDDTVGEWLRAFVLFDRAIVEANQ